MALAARGVSVAALLVSSVVALTYWAVRAGHLAPFGAWPRAVRRAADPILHPLERRLARAGRNPQDAPLWLFGFAVAGASSYLLVDWLIGSSPGRNRRRAGDAGVAAFLINGVFTVLIAALIVRVVASWFGIGHTTAASGPSSS
jgi:hypothetical protein